MQAACSRRPVEAGFTIIEVAVALSILGIGLMGLLSMVPLVKREVTTSNRRGEALTIAEETGEWLGGLDYADTLLVVGIHEPQEALGGGFVRSWVVEENVGGARLKRISVTVEGNGPRETTQLVFLHSEVGR